MKLTILDISSISDQKFHEIWDPAIDYSRFKITRVPENATHEEITELIKHAHVLMTDVLHFRAVDRKLIESGENLRLILCPTVGYDEIDIEAAKDNGVPVVYSKGMSAKPIAEYVIMSAIYLLKQTKLMDSEFHQGNWAKPLLVRKRHPRELGSQTIGILGCGSVGKRVASLAKAFGSRVIYHNRSRLPLDVEEELGIEYVSFDSLLSESDVLSIHVPLTDETRDMIGEEELALMKEGAILINTARGYIVDESALAGALRSGHLGGAAVDAFAGEPEIQDCPLIGVENVLLTPHMCSRSPELYDRGRRYVKENLDNLYEGKPLVRLVS